ncbi:MAG: helix-turn-helix transcriptional regulator [Paludibacter sp.]|nr:helix-turn-helix transcriptional regulator [Paludibacter sp.]
MFNPQKINYLITQRKLIDKRFSKASLCEHIELSLVGLDSIINGRSIPKVTNLEKIALFFNVDMNYFFDQYDSKPMSVDRLQEPSPEYGENPWKLCYELQKEITHLRVELERCEKLTDFPNSSANTG